MKIFSKEGQEKETSTGAVFGWALLGVAVILIISFIIFCVINKKETSTNVTASSAVSSIEYTVDNI